MSKRFINTDIFNDIWFMDLPQKYKLLWIYLITNCDHAGIWQVNLKTASFFTGSSFEQIECQRVFKGKFIKTADEKFWLLPSFLKFQYGEALNPTSNVHKSIIETLKKHNLFDSYIFWLQKDKIPGVPEGLPNPSPGVKAIDKDKDVFKNNINNNLNIKKGEEEKFNSKSRVQCPKPEEDLQSSVPSRESAEEKNLSISKLPNPGTSKLLDWVKANAPRVNKLKHPLTEVECARLLDDFDEKFVKEVLLDMENYKKLLSNYESANLTLRKWLKIRESGLTNTPKDKTKNSLTPPPESPGGFQYFNPLTEEL